MTNSPKTTMSMLAPGERVRNRDPDRLYDREGVFRHIGANGLAQVLWDGNKGVTYISLTMIEVAPKETATHD